MVRLSLPAMSVVGDSNEPEGPLKLAKPVMVVSGIPLSKRPPEKSCGYLKPKVSRFQNSPTGGIRWPFQEALILASLISVGLMSQV